MEKDDLKFVVIILALQIIASVVGNFIYFALK